MLGDVVEVDRRGESEEFGFKNAIHPRDAHGLFLELRPRERYDW